MAADEHAVAFQGEIGAYSEEAVRAFFPNAAPTPFPSFDDTFAAVEGGHVPTAVVPIENSLHGSVHANYDLLREHELTIVGELQLRIHHNLLAAPGGSLDAIREVRSHPQALGQCRAYLKKHLPYAVITPAYDTAGAAKEVATGGDSGIAAIASRSAASEYGLDILASGIETDQKNYTRFLALSASGGRRPANHDGPWKTSVLYIPRENIPGALFKSLAVFALRDIDLFKIESRPLIGSPGQYIFYLDLEGSTSDDAVTNAIDHLGEIAAFVKVLGSYRRGPMID